MTESDKKKLQIKTCQHFLNGEYSVSIFDNGDIMCKFCASELITNINPGKAKSKQIFLEEPVAMYRHLKKIYDAKAGPHDPDYPSNYLLVLHGLQVLPADLQKDAISILKERGKK